MKIAQGGAYMIQSYEIMNYADTSSNEKKKSNLYATLSTALIYVFGHKLAFFHLLFFLLCIVISDFFFTSI